MKKIIRLIIASILGIAFILLLNLLFRNLRVSGIKLPFSWDGPHYWLTMQSPNDHSSGVPFTMIKYNSAEGTYYTSTFALCFNLISGAAIGLVGNKLSQIPPVKPVAC